MAERSQPETQPAAPGQNDVTAPQTAAMSDAQFKNAIRAVRLSRGAAGLAIAAVEECKRLGAMPSSRFAIQELPSGSDQYDLQSVIAWMRKVTPEDELAVRQVQAIAATSHIAK